MAVLSHSGLPQEPHPSVSHKEVAPLVDYSKMRFKPQVRSHIHDIYL